MPVGDFVTLAVCPPRGVRESIVGAIVDDALVAFGGQIDQTLDLRHFDGVVDWLLEASWLGASVRLSGSGGDSVTLLVMLYNSCAHIPTFIMFSALSRSIIKKLVADKKLIRYINNYGLNIFIKENIPEFTFDLEGRYGQRRQNGVFAINSLPPVG